ncbi:aliphatic amidase [Variibacter gotjawalensis]|uniref:Aliphatic amidase n=1 Tax=Variibacter gotjawalensis TaxID=1333996 RepID=A0A0S3PT53_9BRAD|nr:carbon-nitrogen hydrolase family protein [Variibacter gotjawalensis]NIK49411.1 putative amidohydrolase [Variibacter gotjawalensis]RZS51263.1 putative amidohydrolase [Variibacter gotjawalensis]BAT59096.1 aliphatic amidase [Variibacter gotjawalensis]
MSGQPIVGHAAWQEELFPRDNTRFLIAGIQMPVPVRGQNVSAMTVQLEKTVAIYPGVDMVVFSELAPHGPLHACAAHDPSADEAVFQALAAKHRIWVIPGSYFVVRDGKTYNHSIVINPEGTIVGRYDKMFPFLPFEAGVASGTDFLVFDVPHVGRFGLSICYDIWFPETTRTLTSRGVEVLIHPVLTGTTDRSAEIAIVQATAVMFSCYVVDVNGLDAGGVGRSLVADPTGRIVHQCGQAAEIFPINIDLGLVRQVRREGANGLGQVLKSFRDKAVLLDTYQNNGASTYLDSLGPLRTMRKRYS